MENKIKQGKYIKYHGTATYFEKIDLQKSGIRKDFGAGFYLTDNYNSAYNIVRKRAGMYNQNYGYIYWYNITPDLLEGLNVYKFRGTSQAWLDFIIKNRKIVNFKHGYDVVIGPIADAKTFLIIDEYLDEKYGTIGSQKAVAQALSNMQKVNLGIQYCFCTQRAINRIQNQRVNSEVISC